MELVSIVPVRILPASHVLPTLRRIKRLPLNVSVSMASSETTPPAITMPQWSLRIHVARHLITTAQVSKARLVLYCFVLGPKVKMFWLLWDLNHTPQFSNQGVFAYNLYLKSLKHNVTHSKFRLKNVILCCIKDHKNLYRGVLISEVMK